MVPHIREGATPLRPWNFSSSSGKGVFQHYRPRPRRVVVFRANATSPPVPSYATTISRRFRGISSNSVLRKDSDRY